MFDQPTTVEVECNTAEHQAPQMGYGPCNRCQNEGSPNPCYGFISAGTEPSMSSPCHRNWCGHSFSDHA